MIARPLQVVLGTMLLAGCVHATSQSALQEHLGAGGMTAGELRVRVRERFPRYAGALERFADDAGLEATSLHDRARITRFEIDAATQLQLALFRPDPLAALGDSWALVLQIEDLVHRLGAQGVISARQQALADQRFSEMERDLAGLWGEAAGKADEARVRERVHRWAKDHPVETLATRPSTVDLLASLTASSPAGSLGAVASQVAETTRDVVERMDIINAMLPRQTRWEAEYLLERSLVPLTREGTSSAVGAGLEALTTPENLARLQALVRAAVETALRSSLGTSASAAPGPSGEPDPVTPVSWHAAGIAPAVPAAAPRQEALAVQLARETGQAAARALSEELIHQLGPQGRGPLGAAVSDTAAQVTAAAIQEARGELQASLFPQCQGPERARCLEENLARLSGTFSAGAARGVKSELSWLPLALGFLAGAAAVLLVWLGWALRGSRGVREKARA